MMEIVLKIKMPDNWVKDVTKKLSTPIKFIECKPYGDIGGKGLIKLDGSEETISVIMEEIRNHPDVCRVDISPLKNGGALGSVITNKCMACKALTDSDCFLTSAKTLGDGRVQWSLITGTNNAYTRLVRNLELYGCEIELKSKTRLTSKDILTDRQEEIIRSAYEKGYYDFPKKITIKQLANIFDISASTLNEILQRGERKIITDYFRGKSK
jgi:predicted DNA binding protein